MGNALKKNIANDPCFSKYFLIFFLVFLLINGFSIFPKNLPAKKFMCCPVITPITVGRYTCLKDNDFSNPAYTTSKGIGNKNIEEKLNK